MTAASLGQIVALVPVRSLGGAKTRLGEPLDAEERTELVRAMLRRTVQERMSLKDLEDMTPRSLVNPKNISSVTPRARWRCRNASSGWSRAGAAPTCCRT